VADDRPSGSGPPDRSRRSLGSPLRSSELPDSVECPHCGGMETEQMTAFGSALSVSQYWCRPCRTVFEFMKWRERAP
jgi:rubredoxin